MSTHFVTFGSIDYERQVTRITKEARETGWFASVSGLFPTDLERDFFRRHRSFLHGRGYGYWIWKPQVVLQTLDGIPNGDILLYADSGCTINAKGAPRFHEYIQMVKEHPTGILGFQMPDNLEHVWTKREVFEVLGYDRTPQVCATYLLVRKCERSMEIIREWSRFTQDYDLVNDRKWLRQLPEFRDHRHDQSIWSILLKKSGACTIDTDEGFPPGRAEFPIWGTRIRGNSPSPYN